VTAKWLVPTVIYVFAIGGLGVASKLALRHLRWQDLILWAGIGYAAVAFVLLIIGQTEVQFGAGVGWAALGAAAAIIALFALYVALSSGEAGKVVPISASYPVVTLVLAALFLSEGITIAKAAGVLLVVGGVVVVTSAP
jgi:uncharacterized membrane protein